jgi:hypothetical protein
VFGLDWAQQMSALLQRAAQHDRGRVRAVGQVGIDRERIKPA